MQGREEEGVGHTNKLGGGEETSYLHPTPKAEPEIFFPQEFELELEIWSLDARMEALVAILLAGFSAGQVRVEATKDLPKLVIFLNNWWSSRLCVVGWPGSTSWGRLLTGWEQD